MKAGHAPVTLLVSVYLPLSSICYRAGKMVFLKALWYIRTLVIRDGKRHLAVLRKGELAGVPGKSRNLPSRMAGSWCSSTVSKKMPPPSLSSAFLGAGFILRTPETPTCPFPHL